MITIPTCFVFSLPLSGQPDDNILSIPNDQMIVFSEDARTIDALTIPLFQGKPIVLDRPFYVDLKKAHDKKTAKRLLRRVMKRQGRAPKRFITDKLRSYGAAKHAIARGVEHRSQKGLNNRAASQRL